MGQCMHHGPGPYPAVARPMRSMITLLALSVHSSSSAHGPVRTRASWTQQGRARLLLLTHRADPAIHTTGNPTAPLCTSKQVKRGPEGRRTMLSAHMWNLLPLPSQWKT